MGARCIIVMVLLTTTVAEEIVPIKILNTKNNTETVTNVTNVAFDHPKEASNKEGSEQEDLSKTMELILFRPYVPEIEDFATDITSESNVNNYTNVKASNVELTKANDREPTETSTANNSDDHIHKRYVDEKYTKDVKYPVNGDHSARIDVTSKPFARYEITENVIDVPDDRTLAGPVVHNYSPYKNTPLNLGSPKNDTELKTETADEDHKYPKSRVSILHIKAEVDEKPKDQNKIKNFFKGVKNYLSGIKTGVVRGINKLFNHDEVPHGKVVEESDEIDDDNSSDDSDSREKFDDNHDDFAELHQTIRNGFR